MQHEQTEECALEVIHRGQASEAHRITPLEADAKRQSRGSDRLEPTRVIHPCCGEFKAPQISETVFEVVEDVVEFKPVCWQLQGSRDRPLETTVYESDVHWCRMSRRTLNNCLSTQLSDFIRGTVEVIDDSAKSLIDCVVNLDKGVKIQFVVT